MADFEQLGMFYLGREYDLVAGKPVEDKLLLYDSKDLVTHAVIVGMTGSGKTGLCLSMLEEAAIDGIPAIVIDPKGDIGNLLLQFPQLRGEDFAPWVDEEEARKRGVSTAEFAAAQAETWKKGLLSWGQDPARIAKLAESAEFAIYTPGSTAGIPVSILKSFAPPEPKILADPELLQQRIQTTASSLLGLLGMEGDPLQAKEHILLSTIIHHAWMNQVSLDLAGLIQQITTPPVQRVGVLDLESFYPAKERFELAMRLNNLIASPGFSSWLEGVPLEISSLLRSPTGKPRVAIFTIAHLDDSQRMFFVSLLLNQILGWMRTQSGTSSLRAIVYMDEIFGYFPPTANPPSKLPMLTLLKQARAFGIGMVLATQNPVDLDYKGLANTGTWFLGRLQTERDKMRVIEGLEGAAAGANFDKDKMEKTLAGLGNRVFLMNNVHENEPALFQVRWALSYLRGPLSRDQIKALMDPLRSKFAAPANATPTGGITPAPGTIPATSTNPAAGVEPVSAVPVDAAAEASPLAQPGSVPTAKAAAASNAKPLLPPDIAEFFIPLRSRGPVGSVLCYEPAIFAAGKIYFQDAKLSLAAEQEGAFVLPMGRGSLDWAEAQDCDLSTNDLEKVGEQGARFETIPTVAAKLKSYETWKKAFIDFLFRTRTMQLLKSLASNQISRHDENEQQFRQRLDQQTREFRDRSIEAVRVKFQAKLKAIDDRLLRAQQAVEREQEQSRNQKMQTVISFGNAVLGAILGRKKVTASTVGKASTAMRGIGRSMKESKDVGRAQDTMESLQQDRQNLEQQMNDEVQRLTSSVNPWTEPLQPIEIRPKKTNISVREFCLAWAPFWQDSAGNRSPAWK